MTTAISDDYLERVVRRQPADGVVTIYILPLVMTTYISDDNI